MRQTDTMRGFFCVVKFHNLQELRHGASLVTKVFIHRDYSEGTVCRFLTKFPSELDNRVRTSTCSTGTLGDRGDTFTPTLVCLCK